LTTCAALAKAASVAASPPISPSRMMFGESEPGGAAHQVWRRRGRGDRRQHLQSIATSSAASFAAATLSATTTRRSRRHGTPREDDRLVLRADDR